MRILPVLFVVAACGGKAAAPTTQPGNESAGYGNEDGWDEYGSLGYGGGEQGPPDGYGYGGHMYGGEYGGEGYGMGTIGTYTPPPPLPPDISGTWKTACQADKTMWTVVNTGTTWDLTIASYSDAACTKRKNALHLAGTYVLGNETATPGVWEGNFSWTARDYTADDKKTAKAFGKLCGIKKVKAGETVSIHEKGCTKMGFKPAADCPTDYDLVTLSLDNLRFGTRPADNDMCTVEKRPTTVDTAVSIAYQYPVVGIAECDAAIASYVAYMKCPQAASMADMFFDQIRQTIPVLQTAGVDVCKQVDDALKQGLVQLGC